MRRFLVSGGLAMGMLLSGGAGNEAHAFGGFLKNAAKKEARRRAQRRARQEEARLRAEAQKASGVDIDAIAAMARDPQAALRANAEAKASQMTGMNVQGGASGMASDLKGMAMNRAHDMVAGVMPAALRPYVGMSQQEIMQSVRNRVFETKGLTRFSSLSSKRAAEREAKQLGEEILTGLKGFQQIKGLQGQAEGLMGRANGIPTNRAALMDQIRDRVYKERGLNPRSASGLKKKMADAVVQRQFDELLNGR